MIPPTRFGRGHSLQFPYYFDATNRSKPDLSQLVEPVTLSSTRTRCVSAQSVCYIHPICNTADDNTHFYRRWREPMALTSRKNVRGCPMLARLLTHPSSEGTNLIETRELLIPLANDDDIGCCAMHSFDKRSREHHSQRSMVWDRKSGGALGTHSLF